MDMKESLLTVLIGIGLVLIVIIIYIIMLLIISFCVMLGWNFLVNPIFGFSKINFWMSVGLTLIYSIIFGVLK